MPKKILSQTLRIQRAELVRIQDEVSNNLEIIAYDRQLRVENIGVLIERVDLVLHRAAGSINMYIEGEVDQMIANAVENFVNLHNGRATPAIAPEQEAEVAEVVVSEGGYGALVTLGSIFCCICILYNMYQEGDCLSSMSGMSSSDL